MKQKILMLITFLLLGVGTALGQTITAKGRVVDENNDGVPTATVRLKSDAQKGTFTDMNGDFSLEAKSGDIIVISFVGYKTVELPAKASMGTIKLVPDAEVLDDVMVVAYGTQKKESFTGSAVVVDASKLSSKNSSNVTQALEGEVPGLQVINRSGRPGATSDIIIRGIGSVNSDVTPLYVVDGVPYGVSLSGINPSDIASVSVLKDASATALYGARAANGVVLITTKSGNTDKISVSADFQYGLSTRLFPLHDGIETPEEYIELSYLGLKNRYDVFKGKRPEGFENAPLSDLLFSEQGILPRYNMWDVPNGQSLIDPNTGKFNSSLRRKWEPDSWRDNMFRLGKRAQGNLSISGGTTRAKSFTSLGFLKDQGYYIGSDFSRYSMRNNTSFIVTDNVSVGLNLAYTRTESNGSGQTSSMNNGFNFVNAMPAIYPVFTRNEKGEMIDDPYVEGKKQYDYGMFDKESRGVGAGVNPAGAIHLDIHNTVTHNANANVNFEWRIGYGFKFAVNGGYQYNRDLTNDYTNAFYGDAAGLGRMYRRSEDLYNLTLNQILSYGNKFGNHTIDAFVAHETFKEDYGYHLDRKSKAVLHGVTELSNFVIKGDQESYSYGYAMESYFGQIRYDYQGKYFLNGSLRADGSSRFAPGHRWGTFGSVGGAWLVSAEDFMEDVKWVNELKLKASWGVIGNQSIVLGYDSEIPNYFLNRDFYDMSNVADRPSFRLYSKGNTKTTWETSNSWNVGLETRLFDRLNMSFEWFSRKTTDMLFRKQVAPSLGYAYYPSNEGALLNTGVELNLDYAVVKNRDWDFKLRMNLAHYRNVITEMPLDTSTGKAKHYENAGLYGWTNGHSVYDFYTLTYKGVDPENGKAMYKALRKRDGVDEKGNPKYLYINDYEDHVGKGKSLDGYEETTVYDTRDALNEYVGKSALPVLSGGFGFDIRYRNLTLNTSFTYGLGGWAMDAIYQSMMHSGVVGERNWHKDIRNSWTPTNKNTDVPALSAGLTAYSYADATSTRFLTSRSFLTLNNVRLTYAFPQPMLEKIKLRGLSVYVSGDNLLMLTARNGFYSASSISGNTDRNSHQVIPAYRYVPNASFMAGISLSF